VELHFGTLQIQAQTPERKVRVMGKVETRNSFVRAHYALGFLSKEKKKKVWSY
jgi:hypothetical protein